MRPTHRRLQRISAVFVAVWSVACGCGKPVKPPKPEAEPAHVAHHVDELDLNTITLTEKAEQRLGIQLAEVRMAPVQQRRTLGGEVVVPPGQTLIVSAPLAGTLSHPDASDVVEPGDKLTAGQPVFHFNPLLTPERDVLTPAERVRVAQTKADVATARIDAQRQIESARISAGAAKIAYDRAKELLRTKAGSQRSVDEAKANFELAQEAQATANARYDFLSSITLDEEAGELTSLTIRAPVAGILQNLEATAGETVTVGQPLFSVMQTDEVWMRVPVYVGQLRQIDTQQPALVAEFGQPPEVPLRSATYVSAPPSANPTATTVDLHYMLPNDDGRLYPGQKLAVSLPLQGRRESLVVPFAAVLYDIHGGAWVYEQIDQHVYARRRVAVEYVDGADAILATGPEARSAGGDRRSGGAVRHRVWSGALVLRTIVSTSLAPAVSGPGAGRGAAGDRLPQPAETRRWTCFRNSRRRWSKSRRKPPACRPRKSRAWSPCRWRTRSTARPI